MEPKTLLDQMGWWAILWITLPITLPMTFMEIQDLITHLYHKTPHYQKKVLWESLINNDKDLTAK